MSIGAFTDKKHCPAESEMNALVGARRHEWQVLAQWIHENYPVREDLHFMYGKNHGWGRRFRIGGDLLTCLYPTENGLTAQVILNQDALRRADQLNLKDSAREAIARAKPYPEGKWLFIPVAGQADVCDVEHLLELKRKPHRHHPPLSDTH